MADIACENCIVTELDAAQLAARKITRVDGGWVELTSGAIVACDPLVQPERPAFARRVPPGRYAVELYTTYKIGVAALRVGAGTVARWELALLPGQDPAVLKGTEIFGFGVDAGLAAFMDAETAKLIAEREARDGDEDFNYYDNVLADELDAGKGDRPYQVCDHRPLPPAPGNAIVFDAGLGDGFYAAYWGLSARDEPLVLAVDFGVFEAGDGRDRWEIAAERLTAALTPAQRDAMRAARDALERDDLVALEALLRGGDAHPDRYIPGNGGTLTFEAIRLDRPRAIELLVRYGARAGMPEFLRYGANARYVDYARSLKQPRSTALMEAIAKLPP